MNYRATLFFVMFFSLNSQAGVVEDLEKALSNINQIDNTPLSEIDVTRFELAKAKVESALKLAKEGDPVLKLANDLRDLQTLLGSFVVGKTLSDPILKQSLEFEVNGNIGALINRIFSLNIPVGGRFRLNNHQEVVARYQSVRAEYLAVFGQLATYDKKGKDLAAVSAVWARNLEIISQPECIAILTFEYRNQCS